jgi:DNA topoisomerase VI subunit B
MARPHQLDRQPFVMSREREFFTEPELTKRIGHARELWGVALVSELVANSLDACEKATVQTGRPLVIEVRQDDHGLTVKDNGPGLPVETIEHTIDYKVRVSDNLFWVSPTRGQLGNALKCVVAAPYVADRSQGWVEFETDGKLHRVDVTQDGISGNPKPRLTSREGSVVRIGTRVCLPASLLPPPETRDSYKAEDTDEDDDEDAEGEDQEDAGLDPDTWTLSRLIKGYATFNPHADFTLVTPGGTQTFAATDPAWPKWTPAEPTDPHWYDPEQFRELVAAHINEERSGGKALSVREFVAKFRDKKGSAVQCRVVRDADLDSGTRLSQLAPGDDLDEEAVGRLRRSLRRATTRPVKSKTLGVLGEEHLKRSLVEHYGVVPNSVHYKPALGKVDGQPYVLEVAMGTCKDRRNRREVVVGVNWSPVLKIPFDELSRLLGNASVDTFDPVVVLVHLAVPRPEFTDPGKSQLRLPPGVREDLVKCVRKVTAPHTAEKAKTARNRRLRREQFERLVRGNIKDEKEKLRQVAEKFIPESYDRASGSGKYPARARQIAYPNRELVLRSGQPKYFKTLQYFAQEVLPKYMADHPEETKDWNVVYDARGNLREPHRDKTVQLGTLEVRDYVRKWTGDAVPEVNLTFDSNQYRLPTVGPANRFKFALFIEKEGFDPLLQAARIQQRFDIAIFSTKGQSVTAARELIERLAEQGVIILVLTDFDKSGLSIYHNLFHDSDRYTFKTKPKVIHLGLRLKDVRRLNLLTERVHYDCEKDPKIKLREHGATEDECNFLVRGRDGGGWWGERVELNALSAPRLVKFIERKLREAGVRKVVPDLPVLEDAVRRAYVLRRVEQATEAAREEAEAEAADLDMPADLDRRVRKRIEGTADPWDQAAREEAAELTDPDGEDAQADE